MQADYFFGKPVSDSKVQVSVKTFDVELNYACDPKSGGQVALSAQFAGQSQAVSRSARTAQQ